MTAIAGVWHIGGRPDAGRACARMLAALAPYGPAPPATWDDGAVALGRRMYPLLPEDRFDRQPLVSASGAVLVADLRIDNRDEIVAALGLAPASQMADSALLLAAFDRWGIDVADRLAGRFAFAIWEPSRRRLVLCRDALGAAPLFYHRADDFLAFATMPSGLHTLPQVPLGPNETRVAEFLAHVPEVGPETFHAGIARVEPGHVTLVTASEVTTRRWWNPGHGPIRLPDADAYADAALECLDTATAACLRGAGDHVGAHLSAGLDSSAVATSAARVLAGSGGRLTAFTAVPRAGYDAPPLAGRLADEGPLAAQTAALYPNIEHVLVRPERSPLEDLDRIFHSFGGPILNLCNWTWDRAIQESARERGLRVMLVGRSGNMSLSYDGFERLAALAGKRRLMTLAREMRALHRREAMPYRGLLARAIGAHLPPSLWRALALARGYRSRELRRYTALNPERAAELGLWRTGAERGMEPWQRPRADGFALRLWVLERGDPGRYYKAVLALSGIDTRDPLADRRLVEFCLAVPDEQFLRNGEPRALARRALARRLPPDIFAERRRGWQFADWHVATDAARGDIRAELDRLANDRAACAALDIARMQALVERWPQGGWNDAGTVADYRLALLRGIAAGHFLRRASGSNA